MLAAPDQECLEPVDVVCGLDPVAEIPVADVGLDEVEEGADPADEDAGFDEERLDAVPQPAGGDGGDDPNGLVGVEPSKESSHADTSVPPRSLLSK